MAHSAMIIRASVDVNQELLDVNVIDVCLDIGIIHRKVVFRVNVTLIILADWAATLKMDSEYL